MSIDDYHGDIFAPADILIPDGLDMETWSVIACDQFSSERDYWERVADRVGGAPSTLKMILPEAFLGDPGEKDRNAGIGEAMDDYLSRGLFREVGSSFVYVERTQSDGLVRRGLVGAVDLEEYNFSGADAAVLASENTVLERLPARIEIRRAARLELPHILAFIDDADQTVIEPLAAKAPRLPLLYDFDLMENGGHIKGTRVSGRDADEVMSALRALYTLRTQRNIKSPFMVMGDGNHSLAAAKVYWDEIKRGINESDRERHPARRALIEVNNVYDPAISFEAIHRVVFGADPGDFVSSLENAVPAGDDYELRWLSGGRGGAVRVSAGCIGDMLAAVQEYLDDYAAGPGKRIDYIHDAEVVERLAREDNCAGLLLPAMSKSELFGTVAQRGVFPKKSFSVGHARDKRYYLECRVIRG